ncbi:MAG: hypothetical protein K0S76_2198 [Herbinix sp.]|jgi:Spy/CpxP family protein refolding chaperone|nr:hypothetical protein [Herbinix sp.]
MKMKDFIKLILFLLILFIAVLVVITQRLYQKDKKEKYTAIRSRRREEPAIPSSGYASEQEDLMQKCEESRLKLEEVRANKVYASLFELLIPRNQQLMGLCHYRLESASKEKVREDLNYLIGMNFNNELFNQGFCLNEQGDLENLRSNNRKQSITQPDMNIPVSELKRLMANYDNERNRLELYNKRKKMCAELAKPIFHLRTMIEAGKTDKLAVRNEITELERIFNRYGFEFKYYEDFTETSMDAKQFLHGDDWSLDYPALYQNGAVYCDYVGRRKAV